MKKGYTKNKTITLCMIVKDETHIIEECLKSMLPYIDRYDITDTGSTDGTPELIKKVMDEAGVPGEVIFLIGKDLVTQKRMESEVEPRH